MNAVDFRFYLITDRQQCGPRSLVEMVQDACRLGVKAVQLREKDLTTLQLYWLAQEVKGACSQSGAKLFLNDRVDVARAVSASGVQLGSHSLPLPAVRQQLGPEMLVGVSTHTLAEAQRAAADGAQFVLFGPVFQTPAKLRFGPPQGVDKLRAVAARVPIPVFAVGGVTPEKVSRCIAAGASGVAAISAIMRAPDVKKVVREFEEALGAL